MGYHTKLSRCLAVDTLPLTVEGRVVRVPSSGAGHDLAYSRGGWFFLGVPRGQDWPWSSANAHSLGHDADHLLTFDLWRHIFTGPDTIIDHLNLAVS